MSEETQNGIWTILYLLIGIIIDIVMRFNTTTPLSLLGHIFIIIGWPVIILAVAIKFLITIKI